MQYQGAQPVETISAVTPAGSTTPSLTLFTAATWIKLFALVITYITQAATTPTVTITLQDANNNILWRKTAAALTAFTYVTGHLFFATYLGLEHNPNVHELTILCASLTGASLGFLWFNAPPAEVFMGDVGALAIGGAIGTVAVMIKQEFLLVMIGGVFVMEALSVILQVASFKLFRKRIFKMTPIHHHFELTGWKETTVIVRFWILSIIFALLGLATLKLR